MHQSKDGLNDLERKKHALEGKLTRLKKIEDELKQLRKEEISY